MPNSTLSKKNLVLTFGYGNRKDYDLFLSYLDKFNVTCVIDVRLNPRAWSRKWYGDVLEKLCTSKSVGYLSKSSLGNISGCSHWIPPEETAAEQALTEVAEIVKDGNVLLLCAEMDCIKCHRVEVAQRLHELTDASIKHLP
ncbi:DUF488 domain-containing protein [Leptolyngbya boryana CZ1]|uniref:DUF488 domain-containing protein n=1 Tax=Leptolyngbya boryana CZ1 TaxID=3060204 RepID=A0AA96WVV6_LEPBY|nr:DUF488 domain-containing protein [Leptolyngbya boryana]WNZ46725.1 DUF488 domain-containing protein [Leptolyngbya boryana CZ1]